MNEWANRLIGLDGLIGLDVLMDIRRHALGLMDRRIDG